MPEKSSPSDSALLSRYVAGDRRGADVLFGRYRGAIFAYFMRRLRRKDLAEEGLQETFCRLLQRARGLIHHPRLEAWLFSVARNVSVDVCRRRSVRAASFSDLRDCGFEQGIEGPPGAAPESRFASAELNAVILRSISEMPPLEREVFLLRTQATLPFREIAAKVDAPLNTVLSRMHRAMKRVRQSLIRQGWIDPSGEGRTS